MAHSNGHQEHPVQSTENSLLSNSVVKFKFIGDLFIFLAVELLQEVCSGPKTINWTEHFSDSISCT